MSSRSSKRSAASAAAADAAEVSVDHFLSDEEAGAMITAARDAGASQLHAALDQVARHAKDPQIREAAARACAAIAANGPETRIIPAAELPRDPRPSQHVPRRRR